MKDWLQKNKKNPVVVTLFYILLTILLIAVVIGMKSLLYSAPSSPRIQEKESSTYGKENLPKPDRILYKVRGEDTIYIWTKEENGYAEILDEIQRAAENISNGRKVSQEEVENQEINEEWVMLDYDTISKNYFISLENEISAILKYQTEGAISVKDKIENTEEIRKKVRNRLGNKKAYQRYDGESNHSYEAQNLLQKLPEGYEFIKKEQYTIYQLVLEDKEAYQNFANTFQVQIEKTIEDSLFENNHIVATVSKPKVESIQNNIGNLKYVFSYTEEQGYHVNLYVASRVVNEKCIYKEVQGNPKEEGYTTKESINLYPIISNQKITDKLATELSFTKQKDNIYTKIITNKEELKTIGDALELNGIGGNYFPQIEKMAEWEKDKDYVFVIKNTTGHFEADLGETIPGEVRFLKNPFMINTHEIKTNTNQSKIQGTILILPKDASITQVQINQENYDTSKFENNASKITRKQAIQIAKEIIQSNKDDYVAFQDVRSKISSLYGYSTTKVDGLRRVWIVCSSNGQNSGSIAQVVIDATTGEILDTDELGC